MKRFQYHMISDRTISLQSVRDLALQAENAGVDYFQIREKDLPAREMLMMAHELRQLLRRTRLVINGALDVALCSQSDGVHLQKTSVPVKVVRSRYKDLLIGYSAHSLKEMKDAEEQGADYVFISPVFTPLSKSGHPRALGIPKVASWIRSMRIPVFGLGGVSPRNIPELKRAGCAGAAGISLFLDQGRFSSAGLEV